YWRRLIEVVIASRFTITAIAIPITSAPVSRLVIQPPRIRAKTSVRSRGDRTAERASLNLHYVVGNIGQETARLLIPRLSKQRSGAGMSDHEAFACSCDRHVRQS